MQVPTAEGSGGRYLNGEVVGEVGRGSSNSPEGFTRQGPWVGVGNQDQAIVTNLGSIRQS